MELLKILKGSREKKVIQLELDRCPVYGFYKAVKLDEIMEKIDWMVDHGFLDIEYFGKLPMIIYTERGWYIESDQYTDELLNEWREWVNEGKQDPDMSYLKDRNRNMILLLLEKVKESGDQSFIPYLELWAEVEYKKVKAEIQTTIHVLHSNELIDDTAAKKRAESINEALKGIEPHDLLLKCWICGDWFTFTIGEQQFYKKKGLSLPKRCQKCRNKRDHELFF